MIIVSMLMCYIPQCPIYLLGATIFAFYIYTDILRFFVRVFGFTLVQNRTGAIRAPYGDHTEIVRRLHCLPRTLQQAYGARVETVLRPCGHRAILQVTILSKCGVKSPFRLFRYHNSYRWTVWSGKTIPRTWIECCYFLHFLVLWGRRVWYLFENWVALNPGLGGMRDVAFVIISHEPTQSNRVGSFSNFGCYVPKGSPFILFIKCKISDLIGQNSMIYCTYVAKNRSKSYKIMTYWTEYITCEKSNRISHFYICRKYQM